MVKAPIKQVKQLNYLGSLVANDDKDAEVLPSDTVSVPRILQAPGLSLQLASITTRLKIATFKASYYCAVARAGFYA